MKIVLPKSYKFKRNRIGRIGIIDVGSNSVRLVVFDGVSRSPTYFFNEKVLCGLGRGLGKTHYLIKSLIDVGWVKLDNFQRSDNKLGYAYLLTPSGIIEKAVITAQFLKRKQQEYSELQLEIQQLQEEIKQNQKLKQD